MYKQILVPLDGSAFAEAALPLALEVSRRTGAHLHLATVLEPVTSFAYEGWEGAAVEWSHKYLEDVLTRIEGKAGGDVTQSVIGTLVFHFASGEFGASVVGGEIFSAAAIARRREEVIQFIRNGLLRNPTGTTA